MEKHIEVTRAVLPSEAALPHACRTAVVSAPPQLQIGAWNLLSLAARRPQHPRTQRGGVRVRTAATVTSGVASPRIRRQLRGSDPTLQNTSVPVFVWICAAFPALLSVAFHDSTATLVSGAAFSLLLYHSFYRQLARS